MIKTFRVWAPTPKTVEVQAGRERCSMEVAAGGWRSAVLPRVEPGCDYGFFLDGEGPFPDPRSPFQPSGIHGLSRLVDHAAFGWTDAGWRPPPWASAVIYELHIGTFTSAGTFDAAIEKLDYLCRLGITHVELMPVNEFSGNHGWGYDGVDLYAPHHAYGGPDGLKRLVNACHTRGLAVLLDVVYNHLGPAGNYLAKFGPYFTRQYASPWGEGLNFDGPDSGEVRRYFCDNALMWLRDYHFDGLRLDAVHAIFDMSAVHFLEQLAGEVAQLEARLGQPLLLIAESDLNNPRLLWRRDQGGYGLHAQWSDDFHHALHAVLTGERNGYYADFGTLAALAKALREAYVYDGGPSPFRRRPHGRPATGVDGYHFLAYAQNHDQVGNRAQGDRLGASLSTGRLKIAAALVLLSPFVPMLFQGEEWGARTPFLYFTDHQNPQLAEAVRKGRRSEFAGHGWNESEVPDPQDPASFARSKINWTERFESSHADLWEWHRRLIELRQREPALINGRREEARVRFDETEHWLMLQRDRFAVVCNFGQTERQIPLPAGAFTVEMASATVGLNEGANVLLPAESVAVLRLN